MLLILDNHDSHCGDKVRKMARETGVILLTLVPHTSHKKQPLDRTVFHPLKHFFSTGVDMWHRNNPSQTFGMYNFASVLGSVFAKAFSTSNIISGFSCTGICSQNPDIFSDADYLGS